MPLLDPRRDPLGNHLLYADGLSDDLRFGRYMHLTRGMLSAIPPIILQYGTQAAEVGVPALPTSAADGIDTIYFPNAGPSNGGIQIHQTTGQALMPLRHATKGLSIAGDQVDNEAIEYVPGGNSVSNPLACLVGTDPGLVIQATLEITNSDGIDQMLVGFRLQENYQTPTSILTTGDGIYDTFIGLGFSTVVAIPNPVTIARDKDNSGSTTVFDTGFTWADAGVHKLEARLTGRKCRFFINGVELGGRVSKDALGASITAIQTKSFAPINNFDIGDVVEAFIFIRQDAGLSPVFLRELLVAQQVSVGLANNER